MKFTIEGELTDLNRYINVERMNKYAGASIKKKETRNVVYQTKDLEPIEKYPIHITMTWYCKNRRKDPDNIAFAKKFILDGLYHAGIIENDGWKYIHGFTDVFKIDKINPRVEIEITHRKR
jgi:Holliday junction resolvase RusA-like endonuclease